MLRRARERIPARVCGDLARPPLREASFGLVVAFTSLIGDPLPGTRALGALVAPGGALLVSALVREHPGGKTLASAAGQFALAEEAIAGQDRVSLLLRQRVR